MYCSWASRNFHFTRGFAIRGDGMFGSTLNSNYLSVLELLSKFDPSRLSTVNGTEILGRFLSPLSVL
jgi:hypothetical protein